MNSWAWRFRHWRRRIGWPGLAGLGLLVLAAIFYAAVNIPQRLRGEELKHEVATAKDRAAAPASAENQGAEARLAAFYNEFPPRETAPGWLEKIYAAGNATSLSLEKAEYKLNPDRNSRLLRYEINLPVRGSYVQIREFIQTVLNEIPTIALRDFQIRRGKIDEPTVEAQIRFILYLREAA